MGELSAIYRDRLGLLTDLYQLTMASGYWRHRIDRRRAVFHLTYRHNPFQGGYAIACGQSAVAEYLHQWQLQCEDLEYLETLTGADDRPLFEPGFIDHLAGLRFSFDVDAVPEGSVVFPYEPLLRVEGPLLECQLVETALLTRINFESLIATKASRIVAAAGPGEVLEFGLRRAQGFDGGITASRAAYIGGCSATSNVLAGRLFGIPVKGTHAHSWVMAFESESQAFDAYAEAMPHNAVLLVDTYDTEQGIRRAIETGLRMRQEGHEMAGIRLDSGDLAKLSIRARRMLDEAGLPDAKIVASNDLDEYEIRELRHQGARVDVWGVGTRLATAMDQPALGGVYKMGACEGEDGSMRPCVKRSDSHVKSSDPGRLQIRRYWLEEQMIRDVVYDLDQGPPETAAAVQRESGDELTAIGFDRCEDLLQPLIRGGERVGEVESLDAARDRARRQRRGLRPEFLAFRAKQDYPVGLEPQLHRLRSELLDHAEVIS